MPNDDGAPLAQMLMTLFSASNYAGKSLNKGAIAVLRPGSAHRPEVLQYEASHVSEAEVDLRNVLFLGQARRSPPHASRPQPRDRPTAARSAHKRGTPRDTIGVRARRNASSLSDGRPGGRWRGGPARRSWAPPPGATGPRPRAT